MDPAGQRSGAQDVVLDPYTVQQLTGLRWSLSAPAPAARGCTRSQNQQHVL